MKVLDKKLYRTIQGTWGQALAVTMVVMCGTASYICVSSAYRNLWNTRADYYANFRFADFEIMLDRAPNTAAFKLEEIPGVRRAQGRIVKDVNLDLPDQDEPRIGRLISMPTQKEDVLNDITLSSGRYFDVGSQDEVIVSERFAEMNHINIGDRFGISVDSKKYSLRVIGTALSPEYIYMIRSVQELIPSPERFGILWVPRPFAETALNMKGACNNIVGDVEDVEQLDWILDEADQELDPYGVFARVKQEDQLSNRFLSDEMRGLRVSSTVTPTIFLGVATLILFVLLNRMVRKERTQIGLLKAYGYTSWSVAAHYVKFSLFLGITGCVGGFFLGQWLSRQIIGIYVTIYQFPNLTANIYPDILARAMGIAVFFATLGALSAASLAAGIQPAETMRPETPKAAHRIWLERITFIWRRLSFTWKMIVRNVARNPFRASLNVLGISLSIALVMIGFFTMDSIRFLLRHQFRDIQRHDVRVRFPLERGKDVLYDVARIDYVRRAEPQLQYPFKISSSWAEKDTIVMGQRRHSEMAKVGNLYEHNIDIGERGLVLTQRLADQLHVKAGETVILKPLMGRVTREREVLVTRTIDQYLGNYAFMNIDAVCELLGESFAMNTAILRIEEGHERDLNRLLKDIAGISSVEIKESAYKNMRGTLEKNMSITNGILIIFAGVIAFAIIYNVTTVALAERERELASLRVLGFTEQEVGRIIYNENFLLMVVGIVIGIPFGMAVCTYLTTWFANELFRLPFYIERRTYLMSVLAIILFVGLANLAVRRKLHRLDMVETLKARE